MNGRTIIRAVMKKNNVTNAVLAKRLGISHAALWGRIDIHSRPNKPRKDIPVSLLSDMLQAMNYKVIVIPSNASVQKDSYIIGKEADEIK